MSNFDYDAQIEEVISDPRKLYNDWFDSIGIFQFCTPTGRPALNADGNPCGCLTMVRTKLGLQYPYDSWSDQLTEQIRNDNRLPSARPSMDMMRVDELRKSLLAMKEWQERLDREIRGEVTSNGEAK